MKYTNYAFDTFEEAVDFVEELKHDDLTSNYLIEGGDYE